MQNNKKSQVDNGLLVLDEKVANAFYRVILVDGIILAIIGLQIWRPMPPIFGFGFIVMGFLTMDICMHKMAQTQAVIRALHR